jgi:hypothetical protein
MSYCCGRLLKFPLPRLASMVTLSATLWELTFSLPRSLRILCHLPIIVMYVVVFLFDFVILTIDEALIVIL